jgi:hypothetical protein
MSALESRKRVAAEPGLAPAQEEWAGQGFLAEIVSFLGGLFR